MTKVTQDIIVTDCTCVVYVENKIELSWLIRRGAFWNEKQIRQLRDWLYKCGLRQKWYYTVVTDQASVIYDEKDIG